MGKCNTLDTKWDSEVGGSGDGKLSINKENSSDGSFDGKHEKSTKNLFGKCREKKEPHSIWFVVPDNRHLYFGVFVDNREIRGVRFNLATLDASDDTLTGDEEWVATKT